jgi:hypothetical protein
VCAGGMNKFVLFCLLLFDPSIGSFTESYDDTLIQCNVYGRNIQQERVKHLCEQDNNDDNFLFFIAQLKTPYSGDCGQSFATWLLPFKCIRARVLKKFVCDDDEKSSLCGIYLEFKRKTLSSDFCSTFVFFHHHLELFLIAKVFLLEKEVELFLSLQTFHNTFSA